MFFLLSVAPPFILFVICWGLSTTTFIMFCVTNIYFLLRCNELKDAFPRLFRVANFQKRMFHTQALPMMRHHHVPFYATIYKLI